MANKVKINRSSLKRQLIMLLLTSTFLPFILVIIADFWSLEVYLKKDLKNIILDNVYRVSDVMDNIYSTSIDYVNILSSDPNAESFNKGLDSSLLKETLDRFESSNDNISDVFIGNTNKEFIVSPTQEIPRGFDPTSCDWYKLAVENDGQVVVSEPYKSNGQNVDYVITFSKTVKDDVGELVGVIGIDVPLTKLNSLLESIKLGESGYLIVVDNNYNIIGHTDKSMLGKNKNDLTWLKEIAEQDNNELVLKIDKVKYMGLKNTDDTTGITIIGLMPYTEVTNKLWDALTAPIIIIVLSIILFFIISTILVRRLLVPIKELVSVLRNVCKGDFSQKPKSHKHSSKEIDLISTSVSSMIDDMVAMLKNIKSTSKSVQESSELLYTITQNSSAVGEEVARAVQQIASGSTEQAASLNDGTNLSEELGREVEDAILVASEMINATKDVKDNTEIGRDCIAELKKTYSENNNANKVALEMSENLVSKSNEISNITNVIKTITEQTNLLALNASIEAARAGEFGKGFAVVAEEIRKLAEQSTKATEEISKVIEHIHSSILNLQQRINYSFELNEKTGKNIESTSEGFNNIEKSMNLLQQNVNKVTEALRNIQNHKDQVLLTLSNVSAVAQESAATTEEVSASTEEQAAGLQEIVIACEELNNLSSSLEEVLKKFIL
ncbi:hypothetical protein N3C_2245 [Clostridium sp. N3C]|uniref:methyl-accepting chemotaxis protein n=1 Tax=Clostridium sp. N3C TaxID=1776758 RepID=UPI00092E12A4|nr:methyl-accepting chemotaxis protein [Clostridium sp. N3C]SCN25273.1 hypothetical protein N3C_2245 [Clostridium sp. N3C]